jgi:hypothetical protein
MKHFLPFTREVHSDALLQKVIASTSQKTDFMVNGNGSLLAFKKNTNLMQRMADKK